MGVDKLQDELRDRWNLWLQRPGRRERSGGAALEDGSTRLSQVLMNDLAMIIGMLPMSTSASVKAASKTRRSAAVSLAV